MIYNDMRPHRFDDVKGQTLVVENIRNQSKKNRFFPVFILCGQYGSGKTTMARIIAMAANCKHISYLPRGGMRLQLRSWSEVQERSASRSSWRAE